MCMSSAKHSYKLTRTTVLSDGSLTQKLIVPKATSLLYLLQTFCINDALLFCLLMSNEIYFDKKKKKLMKVKTFSLFILDSFRSICTFKQLSLTCLMDARALHKCFHVQIEWLFHFHFVLTLNKINFHFWENTLCLNRQWHKKGSEGFPQREAKNKNKNKKVLSGHTLWAVVLVQDDFLTIMKALKKETNAGAQTD